MPSLPCSRVAISARLSCVAFGSAERNGHSVDCISNEFVNLNTKANRANTRTIYQEHDLLKAEVTRLFTEGLVPLHLIRKN